MMVENWRVSVGCFDTGVPLKSATMFLRNHTFHLFWSDVCSLNTGLWILDTAHHHTHGSTWSSQRAPVFLLQRRRRESLEHAWLGPLALRIQPQPRCQRQRRRPVQSRHHLPHQWQHRPRPLPTIQDRHHCCLLHLGPPRQLVQRLALKFHHSGGRTGETLFRQTFHCLDDTR